MNCYFGWRSTDTFVLVENLVLSIVKIFLLKEIDWVIFLHHILLLLTTLKFTYEIIINQYYKVIYRHESSWVYVLLKYRFNYRMLK